MRLCSQVTVGPTSALLVDKGIAALIRNTDSKTTLYIGVDPNVTPQTGYPVAPGTEFVTPATLTAGNIYGVADKSIDVRIWQW